MPRVALAPDVFDDLDRILEHLERYQDAGGAARSDDIIAAIEILQGNPLIGRPVQSGKRELVIGPRGRGCVALYQFVEVLDTVFVLAVRSQREAGYRG